MEAVLPLPSVRIVCFRVFTLRRRQCNCDFCRERKEKEDDVVRKTFLMRFEFHEAAFRRGKLNIVRSWLTIVADGRAESTGAGSERATTAA